MRCIVLTRTLKTVILRKDVPAEINKACVVKEGFAPPFLLFPGSGGFITSTDCNDSLFNKKERKIYNNIFVIF
jgi:hypothetical protein